MTQLERKGLATLRRVVGERITMRMASAYRDRFLPAAEAATYRLDPRGRRSRQRLKEMAGSYAGQRCFIIGNGPSLIETDLSRLRGQNTFALNRGYLLFDRIGEKTTFLVAVNRYVVEQFGADLFAAGSATFVSWRSRRHVPRDADVVFVRRAPSLTFSDDLATGAWEGATVTYMAMQVAFHLGFREAVLIGVDHRFASVGPPNELVTSQGADPNHFDPNYFGAGIKWQLPDLEMSERAYRLARDRFAADGRSIVDATVRGNLTIFPKVDFESVTAMGKL
ncbi:MAG TPA: hypothetical protein VIP78_05500 [Candidatus Dormibacteraeota bacterium]|jgi:hypothetical protein